MDISWVTESSSYDPSYPLVAYVYLVIIAIAFRVYLVVKPLIELYYKFTKTSGRRAVFFNTMSH